MALRNRQEQEVYELHGANMADEEEDLQLGWFVSLSNFVPADLYSIKKKRGVSALSTAVITPTVPTAC